MYKDFLDVTEVAELLSVGKSTAYGVIRDLNVELTNKGYKTIAGKISTRYFCERTNINL